MSLEDFYKEFGPFTRWYMATYGAANGALLRILHRLHLEPTGDKDAAHAAIRDYIRAHGERTFKVRMGVLRVAGGEEFAEDESIPMSDVESENGHANGKRRSRASSEELPALPDDLPEVLQGYLPSAITPEALEAAREGRNPFGPPPLIERRGSERRDSKDRRRMRELVMCNQRATSERRRSTDRRNAT